eukprot:gb/GFBE01059676.1/.p1 GENE.gb/GFBE01059676.1/~~gb/GFBE01059676.1/.p1  ORF type:complete len:344 (+),score=42.00 gb/GFBE01059676.1/:1-1032(+)
MAFLAGPGMLRVPVDQKGARATTPRAGCRLMVPLLSVETLSDAETAIGSVMSSRCSTPCTSGPDTIPQTPVGTDADDDQDEQECHVNCRVIVKSTFIDVSDGPSMGQMYRRLRKAKTDSALQSTELDVYEPGKFSDQAMAQDQGDESDLAPHATEQLPTIRVSPPGQTAQADSQSVQIQHSVELGGLASIQPKSGKHGRGDGRTTVMMRNLPNNYTRDMLLAMLDDAGFWGRYDFAYLPCDFDRNANLGYAFVNLVDTLSANDFWKMFDGFSDWAIPTAKVCQISWSGPHQGFKAHVERYRNSAVMHKSVPEEYKPVIFKEGVPQPFPLPTKKIKPPTRGGCR